MTSKITDFVDVAISIQSLRTTNAGFGIPLIIQDTTNTASITWGSDVVKVYTSIDEMDDAGWTSADASYNAAKVMFAQNPSVESVKVAKVDTSSTLTQTYNAAKADDPVYYGVVYTAIINSANATSAATLEGLVETDKKLCYLRCNFDTTYTAIGTSDRIFPIFVSAGSTDMLNAAAAGVSLALDAGSYSMKYKKLNSITAMDIDSTVQTALDAANINYYASLNGVSFIASNGVVASGEYEDVIRGVDWLTNEMSNDLFAFLTNAKKIPQTQAGIDSTEAVIRASLDKAVKNGLIDGSTIIVTVPKITSISASDKAARLLSGITFQATLQGAIHKVVINGTLSA